MSRDEKKKFLEERRKKYNEKGKSVLNVNKTNSQSNGQEESASQDGSGNQTQSNNPPGTTAQQMFSHSTTQDQHEIMIIGVKYKACNSNIQYKTQASNHSFSEGSNIDCGANGGGVKW